MLGLYIFMYLLAAMPSRGGSLLVPQTPAPQPLNDSMAPSPNAPEGPVPRRPLPRVVAGAQFFIGFGLLLFRSTVYDLCLRRKENVKNESRQDGANVAETRVSWKTCFMGRSTQAEAKKHQEWQQARAKAFKENKSIFCNHVRTEANFVKNNTDVSVTRPPGSPMEIEPPYYSRAMLYSLFFTEQLGEVVLICFAWGLLSGGVGTAICISIVEERSGKSLVENLNEWTTGDRLGDLLSDFKWFPTFLLVGHLAFYVQRWRNFMFAGWRVEGRLKDISLLVGADVRDPNDGATRALMFKIYRYLVLAMALQYRVVLPELAALGMGSELAQFLQKLGLLTAQEIPQLVPCGSRMRDTVLGWIAYEVNSNSHPGGAKLLCGQNTLVVNEKITAARAQMMFFHGNNFYPQPNYYAAFVKVIVDLYCGIIIVTYPFKMLTLDENSGFQPMTVVSVFLMVLCFLGFESLVPILSKPFATRHDTFNIDALIAGTEETAFAYLRVGFDAEARRTPASLEQADLKPK